MDKLYSKGSRGPDVKEIQAALNFHVRHASKPLVPDGIFGPLTNARVREFQKLASLWVDGIVGPNTRAVLYQQLQSEIQVKLTPIYANKETTRHVPRMRSRRQRVAAPSRLNVRGIGMAAGPSSATQANAGVPSPEAARPTKPQIKAARSNGFDVESSIVFDPTADKKDGQHVLRLTFRPGIPWPVFLRKPLKLEIDISPSMTHRYSMEGKVKAPFSLLKNSRTSLSPYFFVGAGVNQFGYANLNTGAAAKFKLNLLENAFGGHNHLALFADGGTKLKYDLDKGKVKLKNFLMFGIMFGGRF